VYFWADEPTTGTELWGSDGTEVGTFLLKDIAPGSGDGVGSWGAKILGAPDSLFFGATESGFSGGEPWTSDGTTQGTHRLADIVPGPLDSSPYPFVRAGPLVYFAATNRWGDRELWATPASPLRTVVSIQGTAAGGTATAWILGWPVVIATEAGQSAADVAQALAQAIRVHPVLATAGVVAYGSDAGIVLGGVVSGDAALATTDPGLVVSPEAPEPVPVPAGSFLTRGLLAVGLAGAAWLLLRRRG
jgi:ELWxxDGT repeat protein